MRLAPLLAVLLAPLAAAQPTGERPPSTPAAVEGAFVEALGAAYDGDHETALRRLEQLLAARPDDPAILDAMAESYAATDRDAEALYHAELAAQAAPEEPVVLLRLGRLQREAGQTQAAAATLARAAPLVPRDPTPLADLADLYADLGQREQERDALERLVRLGDTPAARLRLAALAGGDARAEIPHLERASALAPSESAITLALADAYRRAGQTERAQALLAQRMGGATSRPQRTPADRLQRARDLFAAADEDPALLADAREAVTAVLRETPGDAAALALAGYITLAQGDYVDAADHLVTALDLDPQDLVAWPAALVALARAQDVRAERLADDALLLLAGQPGVDAAVAEALLSVGREAEALAVADGALARDGSAPDLHALRAMALAALDRPAEARGALAEARDASPLLLALAEGDTAHAEGDPATARAAWLRGRDVAPLHAGLAIRLSSR